MKKSNKALVAPTKFNRVDEVEVDGFTIVKGDIIKIQGEYGGRFKFMALVTNTETGATWIDCLQLERGVIAGWRSFYVDRIKRIPKKRGKRVNRRPANTTS
jgi:hypothetical protein